MKRWKMVWNKTGEGLWRRTPPLFSALGLCPSLAVTTAAMNGLVMGLATTTVLVATALVVLSIRRFVPSSVRIPVYTVVIATFVTMVDMVLAGFVPAIHAVLGLFVPLIIVNCVILGRVESSFTKDTPIMAISDGIGYGLGFTWALVAIGSIRELLATRAIFGWEVLPETFVTWGIMRTPPGAFFTMGVIVAVIQASRFALSSRQKEKRQLEAA